jgi:threonine dehydrogenase-like Zn-dependent dehydrogenase
MTVPASMTAMRLKGPGRALEPDVVAVPQPSPTEVLLEVLACGVCRTDLHVLDGELSLTIDDRDLRAGSGTWVQIPAGVPSRVACDGASFLDIHTPVG